MGVSIITGGDLVKQYRNESHRGIAYYDLNPYPQYAFSEWKKEERGEIPKCRPYVRHIVDQQARYLFGRGVHFKVEGSRILTDWVNDVWSDSKMNALARELGVKGGNCGSVVMAWSYNPESYRPWQVRLLDAFDEAVITMDADDPWHVARMRLYRPVYVNDIEEIQVIDWTDESEIIYEPINPIVSGQPSGSSVGQMFDNWFTNSPNAQLVVQEEKPNPFGIVPGWLIQNRASVVPFGRGDLWSLWKHVDQLNLTADLPYKHNQTEVYPRTVFIDVDWSSNESAKNQSPGETIVVDSTDESRQGKVENLTTQTDIRQYIAGDLQEFIQTLYEAAGSVQIRPEMVTNKGALTTSVIELLFAPLFQTIEEKRRTYGEAGLCEFWRRMIQGAAKVSGVGKADAKVLMVWPNMVRMAEQDLFQLDQRKAFEVANGFTTQEDAIREIAVANGVQDVDALVAKLPKEAPAALNAEEENGNIDKEAATQGPANVGKGASGKGFSDLPDDQGQN